MLPVGMEVFASVLFKLLVLPASAVLLLELVLVMVVMRMMGVMRTPAVMAMGLRVWMGWGMVMVITAVSPVIVLLVTPVPNSQPTILMTGVTITHTHRNSNCTAIADPTQTNLFLASSS